MTRKARDTVERHTITRFQTAECDECPWLAAGSQAPAGASRHAEHNPGHRVVLTYLGVYSYLSTDPSTERSPTPSQVRPRCAPKCPPDLGWTPHDAGAPPPLPPLGAGAHPPEVVSAPRPVRPESTA